MNVLLKSRRVVVTLHTCLAAGPARSPGEALVGGAGDEDDGVEDILQVERRGRDPGRKGEGEPRPGAAPARLPHRLGDGDGQGQPLGEEPVVVVVDEHVDIVGQVVVVVVGETHGRSPASTVVGTPAADGIVIFSWRLGPVSIILEPRYRQCLTNV